MVVVINESWVLGMVNTTTTPNGEPFPQFYRSTDWHSHPDNHIEINTRHT